MERNWLIRTTQNQILGPVAKQKLLEFVQKGALGMLDEVSSGNGYWFSLKEKDLVEKYLYGDIPQGYNPISESKSVLSKRDNPEKTTSINTAPANNNATQVIKLSDLKAGLAPKSADLEFPEVAATPPKTLKANVETESTKLPVASDLEFPDISLISSNVNLEFSSGGVHEFQTHTSSSSSNQSVAVHKSAQSAQSKQAQSIDEEILLPNEEDLAFPDMDGAEKTSTKVEKGKVDLSHQYTRTVALDSAQSSNILPTVDVAEEEEYELDMKVEIPAEWAEKDKVEERAETPVNERETKADKESNLKLFDRSMKKPEAQKHLSVQIVEDKKLLHDRKTKSSKAGAQRDPTRETVASEVESGPLKKRNDNYIFFILIILILIIVAVLFYFKEILNKPLPV